MKKFSFIFFVISLLISTLACASLDIFSEKASLTIISPDSNIRLTEDPHLDKSPTQVNLMVEMKTNKNRYILATVYLDGVQKAEPCNLAPNTRTDCGVLDLYEQGQHTVRVEITTLSSEIVAAETTILWQTYIGWDAVALKIAQVANSDDPTLGFFIFGILFILIFSGLIVIKNQTPQGAVIGIFVSTLMVIAMFIYVSPDVASNLLLALLGIISTSIFAGVVVYAISQNYEAKGKDGIYISIVEPDGKTTTLDYRGAPRIGRSNGDSESGKIAKAFFEITKDGQAKKPVIEHYIDGQLVTKEQYQIQRGGMVPAQPVQPVQRGGFLPWIIGGSRKKQNSQRRLK